MGNTPDIDFILENMDVLKAAYPRKCVLVIGQRVVKVFRDTIAALLYRNQVLLDVEHAFADFSGAEDNIMWNDGKQ